MTLRAVIFDFDGVIADSEPLHYQALNEIFKRFGTDISPEEHWEKYLGYTDQENIEAVSRDYNLGIGDGDMGGLIADKAVIFESLVAKGDVLIPGVRDFVKRVHGAGLAVGICSGAMSGDIELMLSGSGIRDCFEVVVTAEDVPHGKPDPAGYELALAKLNENRGEKITPDQCVVIEDSRWGLEAAKRAKMHSVAVTSSYPADQLDGLAELIVDELGTLEVKSLKKLTD